MVRSFGPIVPVLVALVLISSAQAFAGSGKSGFALAVDTGGAGGAQMSTAAGVPSLKYGAELGAHINDGKLFFGVYGDLFQNSTWGGGLTGKEYFGSSRLFWVQVKLSLVGWAAMSNSSSTQTITWTNFLEGGVGAGIRIPMSSAMSLQPYLEFDSFTPIQTLNSLGSRCNIPMAGARLAFEL